MKICNKCQVEKEFSEFYKKSNRVDGISGYSHICKKCSRKTSREYNKSENVIIYKKDYSKKYREKNRNELNEYSKEWRIKNKDRMKDQRSLHYKENKERIIKTNYDYCVNRLKSDPLYKLTRGIRALILISFKNQFTTKSKKTIEILGCSFEEFKIYLESKFDDKMNWENQGTYWHMDHITPISSAKTEEDVYRLNHYTNFQPLHWLENLKKSNKY
jgi:hypothetical protein